MPDPTLPPCRHSGTRSRCPSRQEAAPEATDARDARKAGRSAIHARHPLLATNAHRVLAAFVLAPGSSNSPRGASMLVPRWRRTAPTAESRAAPIAQEQRGQRGRRGCFLGEAVISAAGHSTAADNCFRTEGVTRRVVGAWPLRRRSNSPLGAGRDADAIVPSCWLCRSQRRVRSATEGADLGGTARVVRGGR